MTALFPARSALHVLLVEDDANDAELVRAAFETVALPHELHVAHSSAEAWAHLHGAHGPRPSLIILDLHLPRSDGFELLARLKGDEHLRLVPVVVLTLSRADADVWRSYNLHANAYMVKPDSLEDFCVALGRLAKFYLHTVLLPPGTRG